MEQELGQRILEITQMKGELLEVKRLFDEFDRKAVLFIDNNSLVEFAGKVWKIGFDSCYSKAFSRELDKLESQFNDLYEEIENIIECIEERAKSIKEMNSVEEQLREFARALT